MSVAIRSKDINTDALDLDAFLVLKELFPTETDDDIARFLLARNNDQKQAEDMLRAHLEWRAANFPVLKSSCLNEMRKGKLYMHGYDKEGHPLLIWRSCKHEAGDRDMDEMIRLISWWFQHMAATFPPDKSKITLLCDRTDYRSANSDIEFIRAAAAVMQNNFPERLHKAVIYPSGLVFWGIWNVVKWFLDPVTQSKACPVVYLSGVQDVIDDEFIPERMGGKSTYEFDHEHFSDPSGLSDDVAKAADAKEVSESTADA